MYPNRPIREADIGGREVGNKSLADFDKPPTALYGFTCGLGL